MNDIIDWSGLKSYQDDKKKSFEELCYQIAFELYASKGKLTSIDDSGGGDGVEFFLELPNGDIWGWQCKFFGRFSESGRQEQIKKSLQKAGQIHGDKLKKWFLCSKLSMTPGEKTWLDDVGTLTYSGKPVLADKVATAIIHWGDSEILNYLRKYPDIQRYFFADKILDLAWFKDKFKLVTESRVIRTKYLDKLHVGGSADEDIAKLIGGKALADVMLERADILDIEKYKDDFGNDMRDIREHGIREGFEASGKIISDFALADNHLTLIERGNFLIDTVRQLLMDKELVQLSHVLKDVDSYIKEYRDFYIAYSEFKESEIVADIGWETEEDEPNDHKKRQIRECRECLLGPYFTMRNNEPYIYILQLLQSLNETEVHISGNASKGKTHLAINTVSRKIEADEPSLFLFGSAFRSNLPVKEQMKQLLDIPSAWTVKDFFGALEICARVYKTKLVIAIDGLNESTYWRDIWAIGVEELANEIAANFPNLLLMTTYRTSYEDVLYPKDYLTYPDGKYNSKIEVDGFTHDNLREAIDKYFKHYEITVENSTDRFHHFKEPLYLKIFCEAKKGTTVSFHNEDMFDVFEDYLEKCNENIVARLGKESRYHRGLTKTLLNQIAAKLWDTERRDLPLNEIVPNVLDHETLHAFEGEDLLIFRDWDKVEVIAFTYDLLNGYLIAKCLLERIENIAGIRALIASDKFKNALLCHGRKHPLFDDILRSFCILVIKEYGLEALNGANSPILERYAVEALFDLNGDVVAKNETLAKVIVAKAFSDPERTLSLLGLFKNTELILGHPLNFLFLSELLHGMDVASRDLNWSEFCKNSYHLYNAEIPGFLKHFEKVNKDDRELSDRVHIAAKKVMWFLTNVNRDLRDRATRALYFYGRKYPAAFLELVAYSLSINDPYVWERTLGALYGVVLAEHNNERSVFKIEYLEKAARMLYATIFAKDAAHGTTHILARTYAAMTIEVALKYFPDNLSADEIKMVKAPYTIGGIRNWKEYDYKKERGDFADPIHMDFSNYTIGTIVKGGSNYNDHEEKQKVRRQIYSRIFELGWHSGKFKEIDSRIQNQNYSSRTEKAKTERYGKKYSWIAYYEVAGYRDDLGLLENDYEDFRIIQPDIDLSFPKTKKDRSKRFVTTDYLGDRSESLMEWYRNGGGVDVSEYLEVSNLNEKSGHWVCLDGFICQEDKKINRERFIFIRAMLVKSKHLVSAVAHLENQDFGGRWLPEKRQNRECFAGEMYLFEDAVWGNFVKLGFVIDTETRIVKRGEPGYYPRYNPETYKLEHRDEMEITKDIKKKFKVLLPVMEYGFSTDSTLSKVGYKTVVGSEVVSGLQLLNRPQTFNLYDRSGELASQQIDYYLDYNNSNHFVYLRKDLLDQFLAENDYSLVWGIWGERQVSFEEMDDVRHLHDESGLEHFPVFSSVSEYKPSHTQA